MSWFCYRNGRISMNCWFSPVIFSRLALYDWQPHCCCIHKQGGSNKTRRWCSRVMNRWLMFHMCCWKIGLSHMKDVFCWTSKSLFNRSSDMFVEIVHVYVYVLMCEVLRGLWLFANIESSRHTYAGSPVFSLFRMYTFLAGRVLSHLVLQRIFRRMPMEEPPLQIQSQVPTSMPSIQRTHAMHAILNLFNAFLHVAFDIFNGKLLDHELTI